MSCLPKHGRIECYRCFNNEVLKFDQSKLEREGWRITSNPLAWGSQTPKFIVLGFSKGPTQAGALANTCHDEIAYKGSRLNVGKILAHVGLIPQSSPDRLKEKVDELIANPDGEFHFGSLIRCTVERFDEKSKNWKGSGGGMLDKFVATEFGQQVSVNCANQYLSELPSSTKLIVMFGLGTKQNYVNEAFKLYKRARPGNWQWLNDVSYTDGRVTIVHVEHFASQGALIPNWLGENSHSRSRLGLMAKEAVSRALSK
ncbi:MAG: hypothetical protein MI864_18300 [Pseudomonadales bacterium]|nr:hypothetical protein [Pseudomonadales bacterium]